MTIGFLVNLFLAISAFWAQGVTLSGALSGLLLGTWIYTLLGPEGFSILATFVILGSVFTRWGLGRKERRGVAEKRGGRRSHEEALANCLGGALFATLFFLTGNSLYRAAFVASFATALADTTATELGSLYGKNALMPFSFKKVSPGTPGAVSVEGTAFGIGSAAGLAGLAFFLKLIQKTEIPWVVMGATLGFLAESLLVYSPFSIGHHMRNFLNTLLGAVAVIILELLFS